MTRRPPRNGPPVIADLLQLASVVEARRRREQGFIPVTKSDGQTVWVKEKGKEQQEKQEEESRKEEEGKEGGGKP